MSTILKRLGVTSALIGLLSIFFVMQAPAANAGLHDTKFYVVSGSAPIYMCKDWHGTIPDGRNEPGTCKPTSSKRALYAGHSTNGSLGWADTDGFWLPSGYKIALRLGSLSVWAVRYSSWGWRKVYGCNGCTYDLKKYVP